MIQGGDVVRFKTGGPQMTVDCYVPDDAKGNFKVECVWFEHKEKMHGKFRLEELVKVR